MTSRWEKGRLLFDPHVEHARVQLDYSKSKLIVPGIEPLVRVKAELSVAYVDLLIEHYTKARP